LAKRDGAHREIDAAAAYDQQSEQSAGQSAEQRAGGDRHRRRVRQIAQCQSGTVGAQPEIGRMAEAQHAGEAEQHIEPHGGEPEH